jgi:hypothetical protein
VRLLPLLVLLAACEPSFPEPAEVPDPPLGMTLADDGVVYAGFGVADLTPDIGEQFTDLNDNNYFEGCLDDPGAVAENCDEPFDDADGDGRFEPTWIGGFGPLRPAVGVHDPVEARALALSKDGEYVVLLALDLVGLGLLRIEMLREELEARGFDGERLIVSSSHNHQGPDVVGLWGDESLDAGGSGLMPEYQETLVGRMATAVEQAAANMEAVQVRMAAQKLRERSPWFNGRHFGGKNPTDKMHGLIHDIRDPVVVSDQLFVAHFERPDGAAVATFVNWSGHPEVRGSGDEISSDYVGYMRDAIEADIGGRALFFPESLGGMQSALGGDVPRLTRQDGAITWVFDTCDADAVADANDADCFGLEIDAPRIDADGDPVPQWPGREGWDFTESLGLLLAEAALDLIANADISPFERIDVQSAPMYVPIDNPIFQLLIGVGRFESPVDRFVTDGRCDFDRSNVVHPGCTPDRTWRVRLGPAQFITAPGELFPEYFWGLPDDSRFVGEAQTASLRGAARDAAYFPQHDPDCDDVPFSFCSDRTSDAGDCDCLNMHAVPYQVEQKEGLPMVGLLDAEYRFAVSMGGNYIGYIVPNPDFNTAVSLLTDDGDHYEDTVCASSKHGDILLAAQRSIVPR